MSLVVKIDYKEQYIHCGSCGAGWPLSEWKTYEVFDPDDASGKWDTDDLVKHDKNALWEFFSNITSQTCYEDPNGCTYLEGWDDISFFEDGVAYLCPDCQYPQEDPHDAWGCCKDNNWRHRNDDQCVELMPPHAEGIVKCQCHEDCEFNICTVPDCHALLYSGQSHKHDKAKVPARPKDVLTPVMTPVTNPYVSNDGTITTVTYNTVTEGASATHVRVDPDCIVCGSYCCAVHKSHVTGHRFCWA